MKSLHYDQCFFIIYTHTYVYMHWYSLFHRDETKLTHNMEINTFLLLLQLMYKHSSPNYQHMIRHGERINKCCIIDVCVSWNIFNRIHFFAIRDAFLQRFARFSCNINMIISNIAEAASTNILSDHIRRYHIATWLHQYSSTSQAIASSQHHPRETRPSFGRPSLYRKCSTGLAYWKFVSY